MGRYAGQKITKHKRISNSDMFLTVKLAREIHAPVTIFSSHSLITSLGLATNLLAGTIRYPFKRFLLWDSAGRVVWILAYGGIGYFLGGQAELIEIVAGRLMPLVIAGAICVFIFYQLIRKNRNLRLEHV